MKSVVGRQRAHETVHRCRAADVRYNGWSTPIRKNQREENTTCHEYSISSTSRSCSLRHEAKQCETDSKGANQECVVTQRMMREIEDIAPERGM